MAPDATAAPFSPNGLVTLTSDFGWNDGYVGAMKGVLLTRAPGLSLHDLTHAIAPQNVTRGAAVLRAACPWFPAGTVHLGVVDPGVGTDRAGIVVLARGHVFVGPDNGLLLPAAEALGGPSAVRRIDPKGALAKHLPDVVAPTFHGRDVFAPTAAALASGRIAVADVGTRHEPVLLPRSEPTRSEGQISGMVTYVDHFGNAITNVSASRLGAPAPTGVEIDVAGRTLALVATYAMVAEGDACAVIGSEGDLEIAVRGGSAAATLGLAPGVPVVVRTSRHP